MGGGGSFASKGVRSLQRNFKGGSSEPLEPPLLRACVGTTNEKKTASTHHHSEDESYKVGLCVFRAALSLLEGKKIDALMAFPLESCSVKEALETIYILVP